MNNLPKVSVIVPVYNVERWLPCCLDSILAQSYTDFELLLVDDGSTDGSPLICDEYAEKHICVHVVHKLNGGVSSARNVGLEEAAGEWICYIDGDDHIHPDYLKLLIQEANEKNADIVFSDFYFDFGNRKKEGLNYGWTQQGLKGLANYIVYPWTCLWGNIHKKSLYTDNNLSSVLNVAYCEDFHLIVRLCFFSKTIAKVNKPIYYYRQQGDSVMHNLDKKTERDEQWVYADIIRFFKERNSYNMFKRVMAWRTIKASQELALDINSFDGFCDYNPDKKDYIFSCPFIGIKLKIITWCLTHGLREIAVFIIKVRNLLVK